MAVVATAFGAAPWVNLGSVEKDMRYSRLPMLDITRIKAITLDLDDTLWPIWPTIERAEKTLEVWLGEHAPMSAALFANVAARDDMRRQVARLQPELKHDLSAVRREAIRLALKISGENTSLTDAAFEVFFTARNQVIFFDDTLQTLQFLASRFPLVALTNGNADVHRIGIGRYFTASISARDFGVGKPDPRIFYAAAGAVSVQPAEVLHVGDDARLDVLAALNCGMQTVWVNRRDELWVDASEPHEIVSTLTGLCKLFSD
ncbi:hydrolase [Polaromonas sp.]|nr:hydrolase [Polaromonas sp.]